MADQTVLELVAGSVETWPWARRDRAGDVIVVTGDEVCAAAVWAGDDSAILFSPTATPNAETDRIDLAFIANDTADLPPGDYPLQLTVDDVTRRIGYLRILAAPGLTTPGATYCTHDDMLEVAGPILVDLAAESDRAGWQEPREAARRWTHRTALGRARRSIDARLDGHDGGADGRRLWAATQTAWDADAADDPDEADVRLGAVRGHLDDAALLVTADDDASVRRANALWACAEVLRRQVGESAGGQPYRELADEFRTDAIRLLGSTPLRIEPDGVEAYTLWP